MIHHHSFSEGIGSASTAIDGDVLDENLAFGREWYSREIAGGSESCLQRIHNHNVTRPVVLPSEKAEELAVKNISVYHIPASREVSPVERLAKTIIHDGLEGEDGRFHQLVECVADFRIMDIII